MKLLYLCSFSQPYQFEKMTNAEKKQQHTVLGEKSGGRHYHKF